MSSNVTQAASPGQARSRARLRALGRHKGATLAALFVVVTLVIAFIYPLISSVDPNAQDISNRLQGPSGQHWLGTDELGRDIFSRLAVGARVSVLAAVQALSVAALLGAPIGLVAGYRGGRFDNALSRFFDGIMSIPALILAMTIVAVLGPGLTKAMFAIGVIFAPRYFRITRAVTMEVRQETFIEAARALGCSEGFILRRHVVPNIISPLIVQASVLLGTAVTAEASLSFIGLGATPPTASWGVMLSGAYSYMGQAPLLVIAPGAMIALTVLAFTVLGSWLQEAVGVKTAGQEGR